MKSIVPIAAALAAAVATAISGQSADVLDVFKHKAATNENAGASGALAGLTQDQMVNGLKEALGKGVEQAIATLGKPDGFLKDLSVKIPMPESLQKVEKTLRTLGQEKLADEFVATMNTAAEHAVPQAASVLGDSVKQMSIADARAILLGPTNAATAYFRRTGQTNLYARLLPIVKTATEKAGVTSAYKRMTEKVSGGLGGTLGGLGGGALTRQAPDLDDYVTRKALDGLFLKIAEQESQIRKNPVARTSDLLQKVFGAVGGKT